MAKIKKFLCFSGVLFILFLSTPSLAQESSPRERIARLAPKYRAFLAETRSIMTPEEIAVFLGLSTDAQRDRFIRSFRETRRERGLDSISTLYLLRLTQELELSEEQAAVVFPRVTRLEREKRELNRKTARLLRNLRNLVRENPAGEEDLAGIIKEIKEARNEINAKDKEIEAFLSQHLTVLQQAKFLLFSQDFYRGLRDKLERARRLVKQ